MLIVMTVLISCHVLNGQSQSETDALVRVLGVMSIEDADPDEVDRLMEIIRHPISLDRTGLTRLEHSGLLTPYQLASVKDYIYRHGDLLSIVELSAVDGFSRQSAEILRPFLTFGRLAGTVRAKQFRWKSDMKTALKGKAGENPEWNYGVRGRLEYGSKYELVASLSKAYDRPEAYPSAYAAVFSVSHKFGKLLIGDFNARFGQGLCLWNTTVFSTPTVPSAFMRRASGLSASYSYTGTNAMTGVAGELSLNKWKFSGLIALPGVKAGFPEGFSLMPAVNVAKRFRFGQLSATHLVRFSDASSSNFRIPQMRTALDASLCFHGVNIFTETSYEWVSALWGFVAGVETNVGDNFAFASLVRYMPESNEHGVAFSGEYRNGRHQCVWSTDLLYDPRRKSMEDRRVQLKTQCRWRFHVIDRFYIDIRASERLRTWGNVSRTDFRTDVCYDGHGWMAAMRFNLLLCEAAGFLGYAEAGYCPDIRLKIYLRQGFFRIDDWDDRIYVYERDAPGSYNVPAFYGRGVWTSLYMTSKFSRWGKVCLRASYTGYPFMTVKQKPGKAELKLQFSISL